MDLPCPRQLPATFNPRAEPAHYRHTLNLHPAKISLVLKTLSISSPPSQSHMMATLSRPASQLDDLDHPTLSLVQLASVLSADVVLFAYYTSHIQQIVVQGIVECLVQNKEELVEAGDDDDDEEEEEYEEGEDEEGGEEGAGGEGGEDDEDDDDEGGDEPPAKRRKKDDDEDKKKDDDEGEEEEEEVLLRSRI
jgi:hypothetical protein